MREIFVFVSIGIDLNEIEIYDKPQKIIKPNEQYNIFIFPNNQMNNNFSNIYISNTNYLSKIYIIKKFMVILIIFSLLLMVLVLKLKKIKIYPFFLIDQKK